jgi:hypothetical protein
LIRCSDSFPHSFVSNHFSLIEEIFEIISVNEDVGTGAILLYISFISPADFGYDMILFKAPDVLARDQSNKLLWEE